MALTQALLMILALGASPAPPPPGGDYIKVEIRGMLRAGMMAIGGETTGTVIIARGATWELDLKGVPQGRQKAESLDGRPGAREGVVRDPPGRGAPRARDRDRHEPGGGTGRALALALLGRARARGRRGRAEGRELGAEPHLVAVGQGRGPLHGPPADEASRSGSRGPRSSRRPRRPRRCARGAATPRTWGS